MDQPGVLTYQEIRTLCGFAEDALPGDEAAAGPIHQALLGNVRSASYDLRIGLEYYLRRADAGPELVTRPLADQQSLTIAPNQLVVVTAYEQLGLDDDMIGHLSLKMDLLLQGLI